MAYSLKWGWKLYMTAAIGKHCFYVIVNHFSCFIVHTCGHPCPMFFHKGINHIWIAYRLLVAVRIWYKECLWLLYISDNNQQLCKRGITAPNKKRAMWNYESRRSKTLGVLVALPILALSFFPLLYPFSLLFHWYGVALPRLGCWKGVDRLALKT
jgi:hypothetical protein